MIVGKVKYLNKIEDNAFKSGDSVKSNFIDDEIFKDAVAENKKIKTKIANESETTPFFNQLSKDLFNSLYKVRPEMYDKNNLYKSLHMENDVLRQLIDNDKFNNLRRNTCGDIFNSTLSLGMFQDKALKIIEEWVNESKENQQTMDNINNAIEKQQELQNLMYDLQNGESDVDTNKIDELISEIENLNEQIDSNQDTSDLNKNLKSALSETDKEIQESQDALDNFGMSNKGGDKNDNINKAVPFEQKKKLIDMLKKSSNFKKVIEQLGRVKEVIGNINKKPSNYGQAVCDIGVGNNINKILSTEKAKLLDESLEFEFYKKYINKNLLEYKTQGIEKSKGPIVVCLDVSGSMRGKLEIWSKAVTIAALQLANSQKRNFRCIAFNEKVVDVWDIDKSIVDNLDKVLSISDIQPTGGTNFEKPLKKALESIQESKFKKADVLFITDGEPNNYLNKDFKSKFNIAKINKGFTVQSIMLESSDTRYLKEFSDNIVTLNDLNNNNELVNIFNNMKNK